MEKSNIVLMRRFPNGRIETGKVEQPIVEDLRNIGLRMSRIEEELLKRKNAIEAERRIRSNDPPCVVCGAWSDDWLCPKCRERFTWMHPDFGGR
jgi:hypothetical protein